MPAFFVYLRNAKELTTFLCSNTNSIAGMLAIFVSFQYREADMVFYSYNSGEDNASGSDDLRGNVPDA